MAIKDDTRNDDEKQLFAFWGQIHYQAAMIQLMVDQMGSAIATLELDPGYLTTASANQQSKIGRMKTWISNFSMPNAFKDKDAN
jgi:hypothetical protein